MWEFNPRRSSPTAPPPILWEITGSGLGAKQIGGKDNEDSAWQQDGRKVLLDRNPQDDDRHPPGGPQWAALDSEPSCDTMSKSQ